MNREVFNKEAFINKANGLLINKKTNQALMDSLPYPAMLIQKDRRVLTTNKIAEEIDVESAFYCWDTFGKRASISEENKEFFERNGVVPEQGIKCTFCKADECLSSKQPISKKIPAGDITYETYWIPITENVYLHYAIEL